MIMQSRMYANGHPPAVAAAAYYPNGMAEHADGYRDINLVPQGHSAVYDLVDQAALALRRKSEEAEQLKSQLYSFRQENELLREQLAKTELLKLSIAPTEAEQEQPIDDGSKVQKDVSVIQATRQNTQSAPNSSPPRPLSPTIEHKHPDNEADGGRMITSSHEEELSQLRARLVDSAMKEARLLRDIRSLELRFSELRMNYDQQQQGLTEAAAKALSYRQEIVDENVRFAYELQSLEQEREVYLTSLLPLLVNFGLQPPSNDARSIVSSIKALVQHLNARVNEKRNEQTFHRPYPPASPYALASPPRSTSVQSPSANGRGLEIVPQAIFQQPQGPASPSSPVLRNPPHIEHMRPEMFPIAEESHGLDNGCYYEDADAPSRDVGKRSPLMPPLPEEPHQLTAEDDEPLPAVAGLRIVGDAVLGGKLTVCGHSINGTNLCNFQWKRYYPENMIEDIEGASRTDYTISADDCDTYIAIQCTPMDDRRRQGEQVIEFANGQNLIKCDQLMEDQIASHLAASHAQFDVTVFVEGSDADHEDGKWEPGVLVLKPSKYEIRRNNTRTVKENYSENVNVRVVLGRIVGSVFVLGHQIQCEITSGDDSKHWLAFRDNRVRDQAVLTLRRFRQEALKSKRNKKWFGRRSG